MKVMHIWKEWHQDFVLSWARQWKMEKKEAEVRTLIKTRHSYHHICVRRKNGTEEPIKLLVMEG